MSRFSLLGPFLPARVFGMAQVSTLLCCSGVIGVGVSPAGTELHRIVSSNPGAEKMNVMLTGSVPVFFALIHLFGIRRNEHKPSSMEIAFPIAEPNVSRSTMG